MASERSINQRRSCRLSSRSWACIAPRVAASAAALVESGGGNFSPEFDQVYRASELPAAEEVDEEADERQKECTWSWPNQARANPTPDFRPRTPPQKTLPNKNGSYNR